MRLLWLLATLVALTSAGILKESPKERYDNFRVYKLTIQNKIQLAAIEKIGELTKKVSCLIPQIRKHNPIYSFVLSTIFGRSMTSEVGRLILWLVLGNLTTFRTCLNSIISAVSL